MLKKLIKNFWFIPVIICFVLMINLCFFRLAFVVGSSMEPTLSNGDIFFIKLTDDVERYDIIVFKYDGNSLIKRVIGCPNETVQIIENMIYINGKPIKDAVNVDMEDYGVASEEITLGDDEYFVLGDNRNDSKDSRIFGPIKKADILGEKMVQ